MTLTGRELVTRLLDVTPAPTAGVDIDQLLAAFEAILAQRTAIIAQVALPITLSDCDRPLLAELERRQNTWQDALGAAMQRVGDQRCAATQLRAYAGPR
jgi:hypothetical protein